MPYRNPNEKGIRREWSRRYGYGEFPPAGGMRKEGSRGSIPAHEHRHLENIVYRDPDIESRGGQSKLFTAGLEGCILGIFEVRAATGVWVIVQGAGGSGPKLLRYDPDIPTPQVFELVNNQQTTVQIPDLLDVTLPRHSFVVDEIARKLYVWCTTGQAGGGLYEVVMPEDGTSLANTKLVRVIPEGTGIGAGHIPGFSSAVVAPEMVANDVGSLRDENVRGAIYIGAVSGGIVRRWDGFTLTADSPSIGTNRHIMFAFNNTIWAASTGALHRRDSAGVWTSIALPGGLTAPYKPRSATIYGNAAYIFGDDAAATDKAVILKLSPSSVLTLERRIAAGGGSISEVGMEIIEHLGILHYTWRRKLGTPFIFIGTFDGTTYNDTAFSIQGAEPSSGYIFRMVSAGDALFSLANYTPVLGFPSEHAIFDFATDVANLSDLGFVSTDEVTAGDMVAF